MTTKPTDDLDAVRQLVETLTPFDLQERERILRWAREKLGMSTATAPDQGPGQGSPPGASGNPSDVMPGSGAVQTPQDIRSFLASKDPNTEVKLVAAVAYYYRFVAPLADRKETISAEDVVEACRQADRKRPARAGQTMVNAFSAGVLDKVERGQYRLNTVGENLIAVVLGTSGPEVAGRQVRQRAKRPAGNGKGGKKAPRKGRK